MCGATHEQKDLQAKQAQFYDEMTSEYKQRYGKEQAIYDTLTSIFKPILEAGPSQRGFSDAERTALDTNSIEATARNFNAAKGNIQREIAARGGSDFIPSGGDLQLSSTLDAAAAADRSNAARSIEAADWELGHQHWQTAAGVLGGVAAGQNVVGFANAATGAGDSASKTANDIAAASNSVFSTIVGGLSGVAGQALGGWAQGQASKKP
jgi:hypothetical protein